MEKILNEALKVNDNTFLSGFVDFDDSPRRAEKARIMQGGSPEKFH